MQEFSSPRGDKLNQIEYYNDLGDEFVSVPSRG